MLRIYLTALVVEWAMRVEAWWACWRHGPDPERQLDLWAGPARWRN